MTKNNKPAEVTEAEMGDVNGGGLTSHQEVDDIFRAKKPKVPHRDDSMLGGEGEHF